MEHALEELRAEREDAGAGQSILSWEGTMPVTMGNKQRLHTAQHLS